MRLTGPDRRSWREFSIPAGMLSLFLLVLFTLAIAGLRKKDPVSPFPEYGTPAMTTIEIQVAKRHMWKLRIKREEALKRGLLITEENDWVPGRLKEGDREWQVKLRLKGDWTDHLEGGKWSFRVKVKDSLAYRRMPVFSLQNPRTRSFLNEWLFHKVVRDEGLLAPRYDFVHFIFNGSELGAYAIEEHFSKEMIEGQARREGPLMKFSEDGMWDARLEALEDDHFPYMELPIYETAHIAPFEAGKLLKSKDIRRRFRQGNNLMHQYKHGLRPAAEIFDLDRVAKQYALIDLFRAHHCLVWHNRRYYFDPVISRLEPVVYDAFAGEISGQYLNGPFTGFASNGRTSYGRREDILGTLFFTDDDFVRAYYRYLHAFTEPAYVDSLIAANRSGLEDRESFLRREFIFYDFKDDQISAYAMAIREGLEKVDVGKFRTEVSGDLVCVQNENPVALEVLGTGEAEGPLLDAYDLQNAPDFFEVPIEMAGKVRLRVPGSDREYALDTAAIY